MEMRGRGVEFLQGRWWGKGRPRPPKRSQDRPKSPQRPPKRPSETPSSDPKNNPRGPGRSHFFAKSFFQMCSISLISHQDVYWKLFRSHQKDPRTYKDQHIRASELLSLHTSEPLRLRVPAANCLRGIREALTIAS